MIENLLITIRRTHLAVLFFLGGVLLQLICTSFIISSSFWGHALIFYAAAILFIAPMIMLLALIIEAIKRQSGKPSKLKLVAVTFFWSLVIYISFLVLLGPLVGSYISSDYIGSIHYDWHLYYVNGQFKNEEALYQYYLYECNYIGFGCRQVAPIAQGSGQDFALELLDDRLEIRYNSKLVYILEQ